jgi:hypothetical protein
MASLPIRLVYVCGYNSHDPVTGQAGNPDNDRAVAARFMIFLMHPAIYRRPAARG